MRVLYRVRQLWDALSASPTSEDLALAHSVLTPDQMTLFSNLHPSEQHHAVQVLRRLLASGESHPDLQVAALLHDAGKSRAPLKAWERALIVLTGRLAPHKLQEWGHEQSEDQLHSWRKAFIVAAQHPQWGARMACDAGASPLAQVLIRRHQNPPPDPPESLTEHLLCRLQSADNDG